MRVPLHGVLLLDKPIGPTSHDVVRRLRHGWMQRRVGHAGTLDPPASGLLLILLGQATRLARFLPDRPKVYGGRFRLGLATSTDDITGDVVFRHEGRLPPPESVLAGASRLTGRLMQVPPAVSARKIGGQRLYRLARRGIIVAAPATPVDVTRFEVAPWTEAEWTFTAEVSAGTYIRALIRDLGSALGCGGTITALRRHSIGPFGVDDAVTLDAADSGAEVPPGAFFPLDRIPLTIPTLSLGSDAHASRFVAGNPVEAVDTAGRHEKGSCRILSVEGRTLGVGEISGGVLHPKVVLGR